MAAPLHTWHPLTMQTVSNMHLSYISNLALLLPYVLGRNLITVTLFHSVGLTENCRGCASQSLKYLKDLKSKTTLQRADPASIRIVVQKILHLGQVRYTHSEHFAACEYKDYMIFSVLFGGVGDFAGMLVFDFFLYVFWLLFSCLSSTGAQAQRHGRSSGRTGRFGG